MSVLLFSLGALGGCGTGGSGEADTAQEEKKEVQLDNFLEEAVYDFSYEKPKESPHILINRNGYATEADKVAFFSGKELPKQFEVVRKETREVVFRGSIGDTEYDEEDGTYFAKGDFTGLKEEGTYYLQAELIGQSYSFEILDDRYDAIYDKILESFYYHRCGSTLNGESELNNHRACHMQATMLEGTEQEPDTVGGWHTDNSFNKDVVESTKMMSDLMLTYEFLHTGSGSGLDMEEELESMQTLLSEVLYEVVFLLKLQDSKTGAFYSGVRSREPVTVTNPEQDQRTFYVAAADDEATAECAAVLAQFSRIYRQIDAQMSAACLEAAAKAFQYLEKQGVENDITYYAACELYKTTGNAKYSQYILQYVQKSANADKQNPSGDTRAKAVSNREKVSGTLSGNSADARAGKSQTGAGVQPEGVEEENESSVRFDRRIYGDIAYLTTTYKVNTDLCAEFMDTLMSRAEEISAAAKKDTYLVYREGDVRSSQVILEGAFVLAIIDHIVTSHEYIGVIENQLDYLFGRNELGENLVTNKGVLGGAFEEDHYDLYLQSTLVFILHELIEREAD